MEYALPRIFRDPDSFLERSRRQMNDRIKPDLVVQLGDLIQDTDLDSDRKSLKRVAKYLHSLHAPAAHLLGNHDRRVLSARCNVCIEALAKKQLTPLDCKNSNDRV